MEDEPKRKKAKVESGSEWEDKFDGLAPQDRLCVLNSLVERCSHNELIHLHSSLLPLLQRDFIAQLPIELSMRILGRLRPRDLLTCAQVSRCWLSAAEDPYLWRRYGGKAEFQRRRQIRCNWLRGVAPSANQSGRQLPSMLTLPAHDNHVITCLELWRHLVVSASDDSTIRLWRADTGQLVRTLHGHIGGVWSTAIVDNLLVSGSVDRTVRVWCLESGACRYTLTGHVSTVRCLSGRKHWVASGSRDTSLRVWDLRSGECRVLLRGHRAAVRAVLWVSDTELVSGSYDSSVRVWTVDLDTGVGKCRHLMDQHINRVYTLASTPGHVVSGSLDTTIRLWRLSDGQLERTLLGHQSLTSGMLVLGCDGSRLVSGNADATLRVWDLRTGKCLHVLGTGKEKHQSAVTSVQIVQDLIVSASDDGTVKVWNGDTGEFVRDLLQLHSAGQGGVVWRICATDTRLVCAAGSRNGSEDAKLVMFNFDPDLVTAGPHVCNRRQPQAQ